MDVALHPLRDMSSFFPAPFPETGTDLERLDGEIHPQYLNVA